MEWNVCRSDLLEKSLYTVSPRKRQCRTVSVSDSGFVATLDEKGCTVLNPFTKDVYDICLCENQQDLCMGEKESSKQVLLPIHL